MESLLVVNLDRILKAIKFGEQHIQPSIKYKHSVIVWGYTGSGKSSAIITLNGQPIYGFNRGGAILVNKPVLRWEQERERNPSLPAEEIEVEGNVFISNKPQSGTAYPASLEMGGQNDQESMILWDTPGFADTKGITQVLINTYFIHRLFKTEEKIKLVFTINYLDLREDQKGDKFGRIVATLTSALSNFTDYEKSMGLLVTKLSNLCGIEDIYRLLEVNIKAFQGEKNKDIVKFFDLVKQKKIPIIVNWEPSVQKQNKLQNPKDVTSEYDGFRKQFYDLVVNKLKPAKMPKLEAPGMQEMEKQKCKQEAQRTLQLIQQESKKLCNNLVNFPALRLSTLKFSDSLEETKKSMETAMHMKEFSMKIRARLEKNSYPSGEGSVPGKILAALKALFENEAYKFECQLEAGAAVCVPMRNLSNLFIVIDFLSTINFSDLKLSYDDEVSKFLDQIKQAIPAMIDQLNKEFQTLLGKYKTFLRSMFDKYFKEWPQEQFVQHWKSHFRSLPTLILKSGKFNINKTLQTFTTYLKSLSSSANMQCTSKLTQIQQILAVNSKTINLKINQKNFIENELRSVIIDFQHVLFKLINYDNWERDFVDQNYERCQCQGGNKYWGRSRRGSLCGDEEWRAGANAEEEYDDAQHQSNQRKKRRSTSVSKFPSHKLIYPEINQNYFQHCDHTQKVVYKQKIVYVKAKPKQLIKSSAMEMSILPTRVADPDCCALI